MELFMKSLWSYASGVAVLGWLVVAGSGCATIELHEQRFLAKPSMEFSDSAVFSDYSALLPQVQSGLAISGGSQPTTCTACR